MASPILGIPEGDFLWIQLRTDEAGFPVNVPATFVEYVETIMSMSFIQREQWDALRTFAYTSSIPWGKTKPNPFKESL